MLETRENVCYGGECKSKISFVPPNFMTSNLKRGMLVKFSSTDSMLAFISLPDNILGFSLLST